MDVNISNARVLTEANIMAIEKIVTLFAFNKFTNRTFESVTTHYRNGEKDAYLTVHAGRRGFKKAADRSSEITEDRTREMHIHLPTYGDAGLEFTFIKESAYADILVSDIVGNDTVDHESLLRAIVYTHTDSYGVPDEFREVTSYDVVKDYTLSSLIKKVQECVKQHRKTSAISAVRKCA